MCSRTARPSRASNSSGSATTRSTRSSRRRRCRSWSAPASRRAKRGAPIWGLAPRGGGKAPVADHAAKALRKLTPHHDERGRFATADGAAQRTGQRSSEPRAHVGQHPASETPGDNSRYAFAGTLIDKRYDENINITHCTYRIPRGTFTVEWEGYVSCPETAPAP